MPSAAVAELVLSLPAGSAQLLCGIDADTLRTELDAHAQPGAQRSVLFVELRPAYPAEGILDGILDALAGAALSCWPLWYGGADLATYRPTTLQREAARLAIREIAGAVPKVSEAWARKAAALADAGRPPRVADCHPATECAQLALAPNPAGLILVTTLDSTASPHPASLVAAVEWCARNAEVGVVVLCPDPPAAHPALDRLMVGARRVEGAAMPPVPTSGGRAPPIWLPPITGRPHPQSPVEQRMAAALARDAELAPLFAFNQTVRTSRGSRPRVDLVWEEGRLAVELDGAEHSAWPKYVADRHRDYELALTGYTVLRIANDEAAIDIGRAVEKIRDMVRFRRAEMARRGEA